MNYELERIRKEALSSITEILYLGIYLEGLRKITEGISEDSRCPDRDSKRVPLEYMSRTLPLSRQGPV
jgi:hypothetical protein